MTQPLESALHWGRGVGLREGMLSELACVRAAEQRGDKSIELPSGDSVDKQPSEAVGVMRENERRDKPSNR